MESKGDPLAVPLLSGASESTQSLDVVEPSPKPKPQHSIPPLEHQDDSDTERPAGRAPLVMMPDGSMVPVSSNAAPLPPAHRTDVGSVERPLQPAVPYSGASASAANLPQEAPLPPKPPKPYATPGPAPLGGPYSPQMYMYDGATPGPPATYPALNTGIKQAPFYPQPAFAQLAGAPGPAPEPGNYYYPYPGSKSGAMADAPIPGRAPDHVPRKFDEPEPGPAPDGRQQQTPAQYMYPAAQPIPRYPPPQSYPQHQFPRSQYQPYQPPPAAQYVAPGPTAPYVRYEQPRPQTVEKKPVRTSKTFDSKTLSHNQYYLSICLCIALTVFCNPLVIICCIPAFYYATKAANENKNDNYEKALKFEKNAQFLNIGGFVALVTLGGVFLVVITVGGVVASTAFSSTTSGTAS